MKKIIALVLVVVVFFLYNGELKYAIDKFKDKKSEEITETLSYDVVEDNGESTTSNSEINIKNYEDIKIGDSLESVINKVGKPGRIDESEYSFKWYVYNQYGDKFFMVGIEEEKVAALYSNSINTCESDKIKLDYNRDYVRENYEPLEYKKKGNTRYIISSDDQYDIIKKDKKYITVFYDIYEDYRICAFQVLNEKVENSLDGIYAKEDEDLRKSLELQVIDLANSVRAQRNLNKLSFSEKATVSSRKHSQDMLEKDYFDHVNKENKNPFDRMKSEGIVYLGAAENIAAGQTSAIYAHEAWMNSEGHRKNILGNYNNIGVGVSFGGYYSLYYTQNFYYN